MDKFVDLGVSFFDEDFTLDPFPYLKDLYDREEVLGFRADGMNFIFRFDQAQQVIRGRSCGREPLASAEFEARRELANNPSLVRDDNAITELLRPDQARVVEDEVEADGDWVAERIITKMPIVLGS